MKTIYVGNLPFAFKDNDLAELFETVGQVQSAKIITDRDTGRSKGFGFVEMEDSEAINAIEQLNGHEISGRPIRVNESLPKESRPPRRFGGGNGGRRSY